MFYRAISDEFYRDPLQNIKQRISAYTGIGYMHTTTRALNGT